MDPIWITLAIIVACAAVWAFFRWRGRPLSANDMRALREFVEEGVLLADQLHEKEMDKAKTLTDTPDRQKDMRRLNVDLVNSRKKATALDHVKDAAEPLVTRVVKKHGGNVLERMVEAAVSKKKLLGKVGGLIGKVL